MARRKRNSSIDQISLLAEKATSEAPVRPEPVTPPPGLTLQYTVEGHTDGVQDVDWLLDGWLLASGSIDQTVRLWDASTGKLLSTLKGHTNAVSKVAWSPDGKWLASGSADRTVRLWEPNTGKLLFTLTGHTNAISHVGWSPDGKWLASSARDRTIRIWAPHTGRLLYTLEGHTNGIRDIAWSPDGRRLASASADRTVRLWDSMRGRLLYTLKGHTDVVRDIAWSPDGMQLVSGSADRTVRIWNPNTGKLMHTLAGHTSTVWDIAWSPDGARLVSGSADRTMRVWDPNTGKLLYTLEGHTSTVWDITWSQDGKWLASGSVEARTDDAEVRIWRTDTWEPLTAFTNLRSGGSRVVWHPSQQLASEEQGGDFLLTPGRQAGNLLVWHLDRERLSHEAPSPETVHYRNAKVILVGESGVGKSGLSLVLTGQSYAPTDSTHGRQIRLLERQEVSLGGKQQETWEVWLWDLAGQPDYRLIHQLHLHEAAVALIIFDATRDTNPFAGIGHWQRALRLAQQAGRSNTLPLSIILVAARIDRGGISVSRMRIEELVRDLGCVGYIETSAKDGRGICELGQLIRDSIDWPGLPAVTSTRLLQAIKVCVLREQQAEQILCTEDELYRAFLRASDVLEADDTLQPQFETALGHLEAQGVVRRLGFGNLILLQPERLDAYASALLIAVKNEPDGLGSIDEQCVQKGQFSIPREERLQDPVQEQWLLIAMIEELVRQELALREGGFLLFPSQSTREHPEYAALSGKQTVTFTFAGPILSIYTRLVVRLAQSGVFQKRDIWQHVVTYTNRRGGTYGLLLALRGEERAELGLFFDEAAGEEMRFQFEDFVSTHLERYAGGTVQRQRRFVCSTCGFVVPEQLVQLLSQQGTSQFDCIVCHTNISLLGGEERLVPSATTQIITTERMEQAADERRDQQSAAVLLPGKVATKDFDVFLCHNGQDKPAVKKICEQIRELGLLPWLDEEQLQPGLPWQPLLEKQITQIKAAAVFVGKSGLGPWQQREIDALLREFNERGCPVIPVLLEDAPHKRKKPSLPVFLRGMTWVDFRVQKPDPLQRLYWGITGKKERT